MTADAGTPLPLTPKVQFNTRARYEWSMNADLEGYWQLGMKYADEAVNSLVDTPDEPNTTQQSYTLVNASVGFLNNDKGWGAELYIQKGNTEQAHRIAVEGLDLFPNAKRLREVSRFAKRQELQDRIRCLDETLRIHPHPATYTELATFVAECDGIGERLGQGCATATHRYCGSHGAVSGFNPVESDANEVTVTCVTGATVVATTSDELRSHVSRCLPDPVTCISASAGSGPRLPPTARNNSQAKGRRQRQNRPARVNRSTISKTVTGPYPGRYPLPAPRSH